MITQVSEHEIWLALWIRLGKHTVCRCSATMASAAGSERSGKMTSWKSWPTCGIVKLAGVGQTEELSVTARGGNTIVSNPAIQCELRPTQLNACCSKDPVQTLMYKMGNLAMQMICK